MVRRSGSSSDLTTCDGKPMVPYAMRAPIVKASSQGAAVSTAQIQQDCLSLLIDKLVKYPQFIMPIYNVAMSRDYPVPTTGDALCDASWKGDYTTVGRIPRGWMAQWLTKRCGSKGLSLEVLEGLEKNDTGNIPDCFAFETQIPLNTSLPPGANEANVASLLFAARADAVGPRMERLIQRGGCTKNGLDFSAGGCYSLVWAGGVCTEVHHTSGATVAVPGHVRITAEFELLDNHMDGLARVVLSPCQFFLHAIFPKDEAFVQNIIKDKKAKSLCTLVDAIVREGEEATKRKAHVLVPVGSAAGACVIANVAMDRRRAATAKARDAMEQKKAERGAKRKISLKST